MNYETVKEFSRRTGIVDGEVDAILKGWKHYQNIIDSMKVPKRMEKYYIPFTPESPEYNWPYWSTGQWTKNDNTDRWETNGVMRRIKPWELVRLEP